MCICFMYIRLFFRHYTPGENCGWSERRTSTRPPPPTSPYQSLNDVTGEGMEKVGEGGEGGVERRVQWIGREGGRGLGTSRTCVRLIHLSWGPFPPVPLLPASLPSPLLPFSPLFFPSLPSFCLSLSLQRCICILYDIGLSEKKNMRRKNERRE